MAIDRIIIPLQPQVTVTSSHTGQLLLFPEELMVAIDAWYCIKDDSEADRVAVVLQKRINDLCLQTPS